MWLFILLRRCGLSTCIKVLIDWLIDWLIMITIRRREGVQVRRDSADLQGGQLEPGQQPGHAGGVSGGVQDVRPGRSGIHQRSRTAPRSQIAGYNYHRASNRPLWWPWSLIGQLCACVYLTIWTITFEIHRYLARWFILTLSVSSS